MFGIIIGCSIFEQREGLNQFGLSTRQSFNDLLDKPNIHFVLETDMQCPEKVACQSNGKLWVAGNQGSLKIFKFGVCLDDLHQRSGDTGSY